MPVISSVTFGAGTMNGRQATVWQKGTGALLFFGFLATCVYYYKTDRLESSIEPLNDRRIFNDENLGLRQLDVFPPKDTVDDYAINLTQRFGGSDNRNASVSNMFTSKDDGSRKTVENDMFDTKVKLNATLRRFISTKRKPHNSDEAPQATTQASFAKPVSRVNNLDANANTTHKAALELDTTEKTPEILEQPIIDIEGLPTAYEPTELPEHIVVRLNATFEGNLTTDKPRTETLLNIQSSSSKHDLFDVITSARKSKLELITKGPVFHLGESLQVRIHARDQMDRPKTRGGDYVKAKLFNPSLLASTAGRVADHEDGTYTVSFLLSWSGEAQVEVTLIHPAETIDVLKRIRPIVRKRLYVCSFKDGNQTVQTQCYPSPNPDPSQKECNFSNAHAGSGWYCGQPGDIPCDQIVGCGGIGLRDHGYLGITEEDVRLFNETYIDQVVSGSFSVNVTAKNVPCVIRHSGGKCLHVKTYPGEAQPISKLVLKECGHRQRQLFVHWSDGRLMHAVSKKCLVLNKEGAIRDGTNIKLGDCEKGSLRIRHTQFRTLQDLSTRMCLHPYGGSPLPQEDTDVVVFSGCEGDRLMFEYMEDPSTLPKCTPSPQTVRPDSDGFYLQDKWYSRHCNARMFPDVNSVAQCLSGKTLFIHGDSTSRQWFENLHRELQLTPIRLAADLDSCRLGPCAAHNNLTDFHMHFQFHNFPVHGNPFKVHNMEYVVDALDSLEGGAKVTFVINIWAHFTPEPVHVYLTRIRAVRDAILRLHRRSPETLVVIKSANMALSTWYPERRPLAADLYLQADDWYSEDFNNIMRDIFSDTKAVFLDVWEMTSCHRLPHDIHPPWILVREEVGMLLNYICQDRTL